MALLGDAEVGRRLAALAGWRREGREIRKTYAFQSFRDAIAFVNRVADLAERADHHPDIDIRYDRVTLALSTHSAGGLTARDFELAGAIEAGQIGTS
ncbi:MAG TPA: 4a-hydroxytetrahydrobiopterin dehydratase [Longimicrobiales bacterium]